jgi:hypothetical protein
LKENIMKYAPEGSMTALKENIGKYAEEGSMTALARCGED